MGFARTVLLKASRSQWLARQLRERRFFQKAARRFMPGETLDDALEAAAQIGKAGLGSVLTELGEQVTNRARDPSRHRGLQRARRRRLPEEAGRRRELPAAGPAPARRGGAAARETRIWNARPRAHRVDPQGGRGQARRSVFIRVSHVVRDSGGGAAEAGLDGGGSPRANQLRQRLVRLVYAAPCRTAGERVVRAAKRRID